jgi:hypothetical protein
MEGSWSNGRRNIQTEVKDGKKRCNGMAMRATGRKGCGKELMQANGNESERKVMLD